MENKQLKGAESSRMFYRCIGAGAPAIIMDAGLGDTSETWESVAGQIAQITRVFVYDRAGVGRSPLSTLPRTSNRMVRELRALLVHAKVEPPYLLVGHSFGGLNMMLYASRYPHEVA
ncbi:MAG TPA: alpha/beta hydrolase, partial [Chloroflexia bacterium]|nr:alpha/beta hydrolase [Chloroflexia bacterium]